MEYIEIELNENILYIPIERKNIKTVRLRVHPNGKVMISAPFGASYKWIDSYVNEKSNWINKKLIDFDKTKGVEALTVIQNGTTIKLFGEDYFFELKNSLENRIYIDERHMVIEITDLNNQKLIRNQLDLWIKKQLEQQIQLLLDNLFPIIKKYNISKPSFRLRKMKTMWGSCDRDKNRITFNYYLYQAKPLYIEYVVLHELIHFVHRNHTKDFYAMLSLYMVDWKERKQYLDNNVMQNVQL